MGTETLNQSAAKRVRLVFLAVAILLPLQFYVVYTQGNLYPCLHLPAFQPVLDNGTHLYYTNRTIQVVFANGERIEVHYTQLFNNLPEFFARHTMNHLFVANDASGFVPLDAETTQWLKNRVIALTGRQDVELLEIEAIGCEYDKMDVQHPTINAQNTVRVKLHD